MIACRIAPPARAGAIFLYTAGQGLEMMGNIISGEIADSAGTIMLDGAEKRL